MGTLGTQCISQYLYAHLQFNPETDFEPLALVLTTPNVIVVRNDSKLKTLSDLVDVAKHSAQELTYASPGLDRWSGRYSAG